MTTAIRILSMLGTIVIWLTAYQTVCMVVGLFGTKKYKKTDKKYRYAICVCARNEEKVIENLLDSVRAQTYSKDKLDVFVVADNCTDKTAELCRAWAQNASEMHVHVLERFDDQHRTKGYALQFLFEKIKTEFGGVEAFDGYFIFDADNVLKGDYVERMNEAFAHGEKLVVSFRNSKNFKQNRISFSYATHWMRTCLLENRAKSFLRLSCRMQGTGYLFANELVKNGWNYVSLTEDREFCTEAVIGGHKVGYCEAAEFYDEQPYKLRIAARQRLRWAKGNLQVTVKCEPRLIKNFFLLRGVLRTYDCFWLNYPRGLTGLLRRMLTGALQLIVAIKVGTVHGFWLGFLVGWATGLGQYWLKKIGEGLACHIIYRKYIPKMPIVKRVFYLLYYPLFDRVSRWLMLVAMFKKVQWKQIPHDQTMEIPTAENGVASNGVGETAQFGDAENGEADNAENAKTN